jgi:mannose-6-phosphate isomerase-like protein (cupin superfamily)
VITPPAIAPRAGQRAETAVAQAGAREGHTDDVAHGPVDIAEKLAQFSERWSPKTVARLNDYEIKVVKVQGTFTWHAHQDTDELFLVTKGDAGGSLTAPDDSLAQ